MTLRVFPLPLDVRIDMADTFGAPRPGGRTHEGVDIFAPEGTPVFAVDDGRVDFHPDEGIGGNVAYVHSTDRTRYVYSHLSAFEGAPRRVNAGELIGRVGRTGNAVDTPPHLHFEMHPLEGGPVNPFEALKAAVENATSPATSSSSSSSSSSAAVASVDAGIALALLLWWAMAKGRRYS